MSESSSDAKTSAAKGDGSWTWIHQFPFAVNLHTNLDWRVTTAGNPPLKQIPHRTFAFEYNLVDFGCNFRPSRHLRPERFGPFVLNVLEDSKGIGSHFPEIQLGKTLCQH